MLTARFPTRPTIPNSINPRAHSQSPTTLRFKSGSGQQAASPLRRTLEGPPQKSRQCINSREAERSRLCGRHRLNSDGRLLQTVVEPLDAWAVTLLEWLWKAPKRDDCDVELMKRRIRLLTSRWLRNRCCKCNPTISSCATPWCISLIISKASQ